MNKPLTLIYEDFKQELADLINNYGLPAFIVESVLQSYLIETRNVAKNQYAFEKAQYEKFLSEQNNQNNQN